MSASVRFKLRAATDAAHRTLDDSMSMLDLSTRDGLTRFLLVHSTVLPPIEDALAKGGIEALVPGWTDGRRSEALLADLGDLGIAPAAPVELPDLADSASILGAAYVLEGSRLGGRILQRQLDERLPARFFNAGCNITPWTSLVAALERSLRDSQSQNRAIASAGALFQAYFNAMRNVGLRHE